MGASGIPANGERQSGARAAERGDFFETTARDAFAAISVDALAAPVLHTDDTQIAVLAPGNGKTRVDERPWQGGRATAAHSGRVRNRFSPDRRGERPPDRLAGFRAVIQADAFRRSPVGCEAKRASECF